MGRCASSLGRRAIGSRASTALCASLLSSSSAVRAPPMMGEPQRKTPTCSPECWASARERELRELELSPLRSPARALQPLKMRPQFGRPKYWWCTPKRQRRILSLPSCPPFRIRRILGARHFSSFTAESSTCRDRRRCAGSSPARKQTAVHQRAGCSGCSRKPQARRRPHRW